jgi:hypothetical protein
MIITRKFLPRRTFLRGLGAAVALPLLDGMVPAFAGGRNAATVRVPRLGVLYLPNGMNMARWKPQGVGSDFELTPVLQPLAAFRNELLVLSGLCNKEADAVPGEGGGDHSRGQAAFLTGVHAKKTQGADVRAGVSMDQIAAERLGQETQLASLELALEANDLVGGCEVGLACAYSGTIAWRSATTPLPMEVDPRAVFERLFGVSDSTDKDARLARLAMDKSILDSVLGELHRLQGLTGPSDRTKISEYVEAIRDVERRIQKAEEQSARELPALGRPAGVPASYEDHCKVMFDLMTLAFQTDMTRVSTFLIGREQSTRSYPEAGVAEPHHPVSHHQNRPDQLEKLAKINIFHTQLFAYLLERLRATRDGEGTLLDNVILLYGAGLSNSDVHLHHDLPILLAGGGGGHLKGGRHIAVPEHTPLANLHLTILEKMGVPIEQLGDSTGTLELVSGV